MRPPDPARPARALLAAIAMLALSSIVAVPPPAAAQSLWMPRDGERSISLEMLRPNIEGVDAEAFSAAYFLSGRFEVSPRVALVAELPYVHFSGTTEYAYPYGYPYEFPYYGYVGPFGPFGGSSSTIGNPYVGIEAKVPGAPVFVEVGGRAPLASDTKFDGEIVGAAADVSRLFAFPYQYASLQFGFNVYEVTPSNLAFRLRVAPLLAIPTESYLDTEFLSLYSVQAGYHGRAVRAGMGIAGLLLFTEDYPRNLGQRSATQLEFHADFLSGPIRPGLNLHVPLDTPAYAVPVVFGASLSWAR